MVNDVLEGGLNDNMSFLIVAPDDEVTNHTNHHRSILSGKPLPFNCPDWVFIPYNKHLAILYLDR